MAEIFQAPHFPPLLPLLENCKKTMYTAIHADGLSEKITALAEQSPAVIPANRRLSAYLPPAIRHPYLNRSLFSVCLRDAVHAAFGDDGRGEGDCRVYFNTLIERASLILRFELVDRLGRWDPLYGEPLCLWLAAQQAPEPGAPPAPPHRVSLAAFSAGMYHRLIPAPLLAQLREEPAEAGA